MKTVGLLGGMSWESTVDYYRLINEGVKERLGGLHSARCLLYSVEFAEIEACQAAGEWDRAGEILALIDRPMAASDIVRRVCLFYKLLSGKPRRALRFERNIRFFIEFLVDRGDLVMETQDGVTVYRPAR